MAFNKTKFVIKKSYLFQKPILERIEPQQEIKPAIVIDHHQDHQQEEVSSPTSLVLNKLKLARTRNRAATLASLYKNREDKDPSEAVASSPITIVRDFGGRKRKRILTKIVRKPYNPETTTTAATQKLSDDDVHTVVRIGMYLANL